MTNFADVWSRKSDEQVQDAAGRLTEYAAEARAAILNEVSQRGLSVEQTVTASPPAPPLTFVECYLRGWKRSTMFRGRAGIRECFTFLLTNWAIVIGGLVMRMLFEWRNNVFEIGLLGFLLAIQLPQQALFVRRVHDIGKTGWLVLIELIPIIGGVALLGLLLQSGEDRQNQWGDPA